MEKEKSLKLLRKLGKELGRRPSSGNIDGCLYTPNVSYYKWHFGSLGNALKMANKEWVGKYQKYNKKDLIDNFYYVKKIVGHCPLIIELKKHGNIDLCAYYRLFGNWNNFLKEINEQREKMINYTFKGRKRIFISKDGHICHSKRESAVDDILYELGIPHEKEAYYPFDEEFNKNQRKRCDWKVEDVFVEFCGMLNYYEPIAKNKYRKNIDMKANMCIKNGWNFCFIEPTNLESIKAGIIDFFEVK